MRLELPLWARLILSYVMFVVWHWYWTAPAAIGLAAAGWYARRLQRLRWLAFAASALLALPFVIAVVVTVIQR